MKCVGIDPGTNGGIGVIVDDKVFALKLPESEAEVCKVLQTTVLGADLVVLERVGGFVGGGEVCPVCHQAKNQSPGSAMFVFGRGVGVIVGCLLSLGVKVEEIEPQRWQSTLGLKRPKAMTQDNWKRELKRVAQQLYPSVKVTLAVSDALLLARYSKVRCEGFVEAVPMV